MAEGGGNNKTVGQYNQLKQAASKGTSKRKVGSLGVTWQRMHLKMCDTSHFLVSLISFLLSSEPIWNDPRLYFCVTQQFYIQWFKWSGHSGGMGGTCSTAKGFWHTVGVFMTLSLPDCSLSHFCVFTFALKCITDRGQVMFGSQKHCCKWFMEKRTIVSRTEIPSYRYLPTSLRIMLMGEKTSGFM